MEVLVEREIRASPADVAKVMFDSDRYALNCDGDWEHHRGVSITSTIA